MYKYTFGCNWFHGSEIKRLLLNLIPQNFLLSQNNILEIGCFEGLSSVFFADNLINHQSSTLICVDPFLAIENNDHKHLLLGDQEKNFDYNIKICNNSEKIVVKKITSDKFFEDNDMEYDLIYIDGSHECSQINRDMENSFKVLKKNGIMWMDDYGGGELDKNGVGYIKHTMNLFCQRHEGEYKLIHANYQLAIVKI